MTTSLPTKCSVCGAGAIRHEELANMALCEPCGERWDTAYANTFHAQGYALGQAGAKIMRPLVARIENALRRFSR